MTDLASSPNSPGSSSSGIRPTPAESWGEYRAICQLAEGGSASVYLALDHSRIGMNAAQAAGASSSPLVAIKVLHGSLKDDPAYRELLRREARLIAQIQHPNVAALIELGERAAGPYLVMEYVEGTSLAALQAHLARTGSWLTPETALTICIDTLYGLHAAHQATNAAGENLHIVHRDISPQNILVGVNGQTKVVDFGVAHTKSQALKQESLQGKLAYMSPEQLYGAPVDARSDIYALGIVAWELLTAKRLFKQRYAEHAASGGAPAKAVTQAPSVRSLKPHIPEAIDRCIQRALAPNPSDRYESSQAFASALTQAMKEAGLRITHPAVSLLVEGAAGRELAMRRASTQAALAQGFNGSSADPLDPDADEATRLMSSLSPSLLPGRSGFPSRSGVSMLEKLPAAVAAERAGSPSAPPPRPRLGSLPPLPQIPSAPPLPSGRGLPSPAPQTSERMFPDSNHALGVEHGYPREGSGLSGSASLVATFATTEVSGSFYLPAPKPPPRQGSYAGPLPSAATPFVAAPLTQGNQPQQNPGQITITDSRLSAQAASVAGAQSASIAGAQSAGVPQAASAAGGPQAASFANPPNPSEALIAAPAAAGMKTWQWAALVFATLLTVGLLLFAVLYKPTVEPTVISPQRAVEPAPAPAPSPSSPQASPVDTASDAIRLEDIPTVNDAIAVPSKGSTAAEPERQRDSAGPKAVESSGPPKEPQRLDQPQKSNPSQAEPSPKSPTVSDKDLVNPYR